MDELDAPAVCKRVAGEAHHAPSVILLTDSTPNINNTVDMDPPPLDLEGKETLALMETASQIPS